MILKNYELNKINFKSNYLILFYGNNNGLKLEEINKILYRNQNFKKLIFFERDILINENSFFDEIFSGSLFDEKKIIIINNVSEKILKIIDQIENKDIQDIILIFNSEQLDKKSKLRAKFERQKNLICTAFYPDTEEILIKIAYNFFKEKKISISQSNINIIVNRSDLKREFLYNELNKIEFLSLTKTITTENIMKLSNLANDFSISELVDNCLAQNKKKAFYILNENNFSLDDSIIILRTFVTKAKKLSKLITEFKKNSSIEKTISASKPPIFWKNKELIKKQIITWSSLEIKKLLFDLNKIEYQCKKNLDNSIKIVTNFIIQSCFD